MISQFVNQGVFHLNPHTPVAQKVADEVGFRRFQGEVVEFFKSDLTDLCFHFSMAHTLWVLYQDHVLSQIVL